MKTLKEMCQRWWAWVTAKPTDEHDDRLPPLTEAQLESVRKMLREAFQNVPPRPSAEEFAEDARRAFAYPKWFLEWKRGGK